MVAFYAHALSFGGAQQDEFLPVNQAFQTTLEQADGWQVTLQSAEHYYLYVDKLRVFTADSFGEQTLEHQAPAGDDYPDPLFGTVKVWHDAVTARLTSQARGELWVEFQGCAEAGFCYPPERRLLGVISN